MAAISKRNSRGNTHVSPVNRRSKTKTEKLPTTITANNNVNQPEIEKATRTLFVGNLKVAISESDLRRVFERYGNVEYVDIKRPLAGQGNAYAFVKYLSPRQALRAKVEMSGQYIGKLRCEISFTKDVKNAPLPPESSSISSPPSPSPTIPLFSSSSTKGKPSTKKKGVKKIKSSTNVNTAKSTSKIPTKPKQSTNKTGQKKVKCNARVKKKSKTRTASIKENDNRVNSEQFRRRGQRMASLNAICKVHLLFESKRDSPTPSPIPPPSLSSASTSSSSSSSVAVVKSKESQSTTKKKATIKKSSASLTNGKSSKNVKNKKGTTKKPNQGKKSSKATPPKAKKVSKINESKGKELVLHDPSTRQIAIPKKRKFIDDEIELIDTRSCKRMASLNASAILAASSLPDKKLFRRERSNESIRSAGSTVEMIHETKISSNSRVQVPSSSGDIHSVTSNQVVVESAQTIEFIKKVRRSSGKIRERLLAIEMMEREFDLEGKGLKVGNGSGSVQNGHKVIKSGVTEKTVTEKSVKKCRRSIQRTTTTREATTGLRRTTEYQVTKVQINTSKATDLSAERKKSAHRRSSHHHQIETILNKDAIVQKYHIHHKTKATSQSYRVQMETSSFHPASSNPSSTLVNSNNELLAATNTVHTVPCLPFHQSSTGPTVGDIHFTNGANLLQNSPLLAAAAAVSNPGLNHNAAAAACFSYPNQPSFVQLACNQPYRALTSTNSSINQINSIPVLNIGPPQYQPHYTSAFSMPQHTNHAASINYPTESYGFYQHNGSLIQPIHDPYIRAYSLHKPIPYHASHMAHHSDQTYKEFNPIITIHQAPSHHIEPQHLSVNIAVSNPTTVMTREPIATIAATTQATISTNPLNFQTISNPSTSVNSNGSTGGPSIAFLGSTSILPNRLASSMFQALSTSSSNSIISSDLPQGLSPVPGPAPVAIATPVSVENITSLSTASPSLLPGEIASLNSTSSISTQVDFAPISTVNHNHHSRSPSNFGSPTDNNHCLPNVATISPLVTPVTHRASKSVSCSTNTDPESRSSSNSHHHHSNQNNQSPQTHPIHQHYQQSPSPTTSQSTITITPVNINSSGNYTTLNSIRNTTITSINNNTNKTSNNFNGTSNKQQKFGAHQSSNSLKDASINTSNGKDSPTITMNRKNQRKQQFENSNTSNVNISNNNSSNNHYSSTSNFGKSKTQSTRVRYQPQTSNSSSSDSSSPSILSGAAIGAPISTSTSLSSSSNILSSLATSSPPSNFNSSSTSLLPLPFTHTTASASISSPSSGSGISSSSSNTTSPPSGQPTLISSSNKKAISPTLTNNNHSNGLLSPNKKRLVKSNKTPTTIGTNLVSEVQALAIKPTTTICPAIEIGPSRKTVKKRLFHGWSWRGNPTRKPVFIKPDDPPQLRDCYPAICHIQGDVIKVRDCVLLRGGPRKTDLHFVARICSLWEAPETGEMMMNLLWYYRPEHTEPGRKPNDQADEIFASKHLDVNSVACIDDKCYVLTFNEYCRYRTRQKMEAENISLSLTDALVPTGRDYNRRSKLPKRKVFPDRVFFCRKVYDFRLGRTLKNPASPVLNDSASWRRRE